MKKQQKKQIKSSLKKIKIDVYGIEVHVGINYSRKLFAKTYFTDRECTKPVTDFDDSFDSKGFEWAILSTKNARRVAFIHVDTTRAESKLDLMDTITHESFHAASDILNWIGMSLTRESAEAYAYLVGYISSHVLNAVGI